METSIDTTKQILVFIAIAAVIIASITAFLMATGVLGKYTMCNMICGLRIEGGILGALVPFGEACGC